MELNWRTIQHLKETEAVPTTEEIKVWFNEIPNTISIFKRQYYKKRNGKTCYVDSGHIDIPADMSRIMKYYKNTTIDINDWNCHTYTCITYKPRSDYKEELKKWYNETRRNN